MSKISSDSKKWKDLVKKLPNVHSTIGNESKRRSRTERTSRLIDFLHSQEILAVNFKEDFKVQTKTRVSTGRMWVGLATAKASTSRSINLFFD